MYKSLKKEVLIGVLISMSIITCFGCPPDTLGINNKQFKWHKVKDLPSGAEMTVLAGNPSKHEPFIARFKIPANYHMQPHSHPVDEYDTVLSGTLYLQRYDTKNPKVEIITTGGFFMVPANVSHSIWTKEETILQVNGTGPWGLVYQEKK